MLKYSKNNNILKIKLFSKTPSYSIQLSNIIKKAMLADIQSINQMIFTTKIETYLDLEDYSKTNPFYVFDCSKFKLDINKIKAITPFFKSGMIYNTTFDNLIYDMVILTYITNENKTIRNLTINIIEDNVNCDYLSNYIELITDPIHNPNYKINVINNEFFDTTNEGKLAICMTTYKLIKFCEWIDYLNIKCTIILCSNNSNNSLPICDFFNNYNGSIDSIVAFSCTRGIIFDTIKIFLNSNPLCFNNKLKIFSKIIHQFSIQLNTNDKNEYELIMKTLIETKALLSEKTEIMISENCTIIYDPNITFFQKLKKFIFG